MSEGYDVPLERDLELDPVLEPIWQEAERRHSSSRLLWWLGLAVLFMIAGIVWALFSFENPLTATQRLVYLGFACPPVAVFFHMVRVGQRESRFFMDQAARIGVDEEAAGNWFAARHE